jgi:hypothetical protein
MFAFPRFERIVARCNGWRLEYDPDRCAIALDNFDRIGAGLSRRPN